ncbi:MAG: nicotinate phosphoribosyltransferase [Chloroflexi bacterium]|nr:nicotinate phosphoribosyltransferase [Chloroflexota bacterium]
MAQSYLREGMHGEATFSLFARTLPPGRAYLVAAGLEDVLRYLQGLRFSPIDLDYLGSTGIFGADFLEHLKGFRFTGSVWAVPEGRLVFPNEPLLEVTAPIPEAQIVETYIINQVHLQTTIATKAARCLWAAGGRRLVDFSLRRTHGADAGLKVARASYIAGFESTSNVLAGRQYGIPIAGTMAHSYVSSFPEEIDAFRAYARTFPDASVFLIDTYDTLEGARKAAVVAREMEVAGHRLRAVRLDSGDLIALSRAVRKVMDDAGLVYVGIFASGGLDEYELETIARAGAPIGGFGVGTKMGVSADAPYLDMAYKLVKYAGHPVLKLSTGKVSLADQKQVYRGADAAGQLREDTIALRDEGMEGADQPLLARVMEGGRILHSLPSLDEIRLRFQDEFARLPHRYKALRGAPQYPVRLSPGLSALQSRLEHQLAAVAPDP